LQPLVDGPGVTDVLVNGPDSVWVDCGDGLRRVAVDLGGEQGVRALAVRLAAGAGRRLDESVPWVDARLPAGVRLHAVIPPVSPSGTHLSLRVLRSGRLDLETLVAGGCLHPAWREVLQRLVTWHAAFLVTGGTGSGKTTLLAALLSLAPVQERLVLVEDVAELQPAHPHVVRLEARHANVEGRGGIGLEVLVRQALRMRPDRIVVGECRGPEVRDLLAALNTGHAGGCGTLHANAPAEVPARLEALGLMAGLGRDAVQAQAAAAFDAVVHLIRGPDGVRRVVEVAAVCAGRDGSVQVQMALRRNATEQGGGNATEQDGGNATEQDGGSDGRKGEGGTGRGHDQGPGDGYVTGPGWPVLAARLGLTC
jgi:pilus assembly protein CpaF